MRIANPIYDAVFKYLLEDVDIAKGIIGRIIGEEITELYFQPEEVKTKNEKYLVIILRIDFKAVIKTKMGEYKKVLIEIQKGRESDDIVRFRRYLSENYKGKDSVVGEEGQEKQVLPVIPIYFLGFPLKRIKTPALKVDRTYFDLIHNKEIKVKNDFIERLTHDGYFIQIGKLNQIDPNASSSLERILHVFNQSYRLTSDSRLLEISAEEIESDPLLQKMIARLRKAATDSNILRRIEVEEEFEKRLEKQIRKVANLEERIEEIDKVLEDKDKALEDKDKALEDKDKALEDKDKALEDKDKALENKDKALRKLEKEKIAAAESLIKSTDLTDEQIANIQNLTVTQVQSLRDKPS